MLSCTVYAIHIWRLKFGFLILLFNAWVTVHHVLNYWTYAKPVLLYILDVGQYICSQHLLALLFSLYCCYIYKYFAKRQFTVNVIVWIIQVIPMFPFYTVSLHKHLKPYTLKYDIYASPTVSKGSLAFTYVVWVPPHSRSLPSTKQCKELSFQFGCNNAVNIWLGSNVLPSMTRLPLPVTL